MEADAHGAHGSSVGAAHGVHAEAGAAAAARAAAAAHAEQQHAQQQQQQQHAEQQQLLPQGRREGKADEGEGGEDE